MSKSITKEQALHELQQLLASRDATEVLLGDYTHWPNLKRLAMDLVDKGADFTLAETEHSHSTLLHFLVKTNRNGINDLEINKLMESNTSFLENIHLNGNTVLMSLVNELINSWTDKKCSFDDFKKTAMILARKGAILNFEDKDFMFYRLLHIFFDKNKDGTNNDEIQELINLNKRALNYKGYNGSTLIHFLLSHNPNINEDILNQLLSAENLNATNNHNETLLHAACHSGNLSAVQFLTEKGLSLTALTDTNDTLIHLAAHSGNKDLVQWLIDTKQIDINAKNSRGDTALYFPALKVHNKKGREMIELLARNGADLKDEFFQRIWVLRYYGIKLDINGISKGKVVMALADELKTMAEEFFNKEPEERNFTDFETRFKKLLHSKDDKIKAYRIQLDTIMTNIAIALTGIGLFFIAGKLIHSKVIEGRALFFCQKSKTTSEEKIADIESDINLLSQNSKK